MNLFRATKREREGWYADSCYVTTSAAMSGGLSRWVTVLVTHTPSPSSSSSSSAETMRLDPSISGFLSTMLQDAAFAQEHVNTDTVIADLSEGAMGPECAADIDTTLQVAHGRLQVTNVVTAAQTLRGADYLQLREELYLEAAARILFQALQAPPSPPPLEKQAQAAVVVPCVHTGQRMWDRLGAYNTLQLEKRGIISLGHKGHIDATDERIDEELLRLAATLNDVTSLDLAGNSNIATCEPFGSTLQELVIDNWTYESKTRLGDEGLKHCRKLRRLQCTRKVTTCEPFADTLEEFIQTTSKSQGDHGINDKGLKHCTKLKVLLIPDQKKVTTCAPFAETLEELDISFGTNITDAALKDVKHLKRLKASYNGGITTCEPFADTLEELEAKWHHEIPVGGISDEVLKHCTKLKSLDVSGNTLITTCDPFAATLEKVYCGFHYIGAGLTDEGLRRCTKVKKALIDSDKLTPAPFTDILESIECHVSHIEQLQRFTQLKAMHLFSEHSQRRVLEPFSSSASFVVALEELYLSYVSFTGELHMFKRLKVLLLHNINGTIGSLPSTLEELSMTSVSRALVNDETVKSCTKLRVLRLGRCSSITTCEPFASTLEELRVPSGECGMNDEAIQNCTKLKYLDLSSCPHITHCDPFATTLEKLHVYHPCGLTNDSVRRCVRLTKLDVRGEGPLTLSLKDLTYS